MKKGPQNPILTIRLNEAEHLRFWRLMDLAKARNAYAGKSDVLRELLGLTAAEVLTEDEIHYFRTGEKRRPMDAPQKLTPSTRIHFKHEDDIKKKRKTG